MSTYIKTNALNTAFQLLKVIASGKLLQEQITEAEAELHMHFDQKQLLTANSALLDLLQKIEAETAHKLRNDTDLLNSYFRKITIAQKDYENVRSQSFRECPSRLTCAFFFRNLSDARIFFYSIFCRAQILSVRLLQGKLIACDQNIINKYLDGTQQQRKDEYEYWDVLLRIHCGNFFLKDVFSKTSETMIAMRRISVSGAQEKFPAVIENGIIRISQTDERSRYILKPAPWDNTLYTRKQIPANEHLTMQIASQVYGIITAENGLCFTPHGDMVYITKRFDIAKDGSKYLMEDFASLVGKNEAEQGTYFKYDGCFEDIACAIKRYIPAWMIAMERFFKLVVFNYIYGNGDDHLKNFSIMRIGEHYQLAPAYDLMNTCLHIEGDDLGLNGGLSLTLEKSDVYERTGHPCRLDFERFGELIGLKKKRIEMILDSFSVLPDEVERLTNNSFLNDKLKRTYLRIVKERIQRFNRKSE